MEDRVNKKRRHFLVPALFFLLLLLLFFLWYLFGRQKVQDWETYVMKDPTAVPAPEPNKQLIVFLKPGAQRQNFNEWIADSLVKKGEVRIRFVCRNCDSSLFLFEGDGVESYIKEKLLLMGSGGTAKGGNAPQNPRPNPAGETDDLYYTTNVRVKSDDAASQEIVPGIIEQPGYSDAPVKVAVFDTGLDTLTATAFKFVSAGTSCIPGAEGGWNFMNGSSTWIDDYPGRHGTVVARFIANETVKYGKNSLEILPVKIFDGNGSSDLFSILCAFAYASQQHVNIINASFGYYESAYEIDTNGNVTTRPTSPVLLQAFVNTYLTQKNILLIAAAGNKNDAENSVYNPVNPADQRNLDSVHFYPASLSLSLPNVIAVTTAYDSVVSPRQNFSNKVVDVCVHADRILQNAYEVLASVQREIDSIRQKLNLPPSTGNNVSSNINRAQENLGHLSDELSYPHFTFLHPYKPGQLVEGSSFATPIVTGKLVAWFHLYNHLLDSGLVFTSQTRDSIFQILQTKAQESFLINKTELNNKIKQGKMIYRSLNSGEGEGVSPVQTLLQQKPRANNGTKRK